MTTASRQRCLKCDPCFGDAIGISCITFQGPLRWPDLLEGGFKHLGNRWPAFQRFNVPGKTDQVASIALDIE